MQQCLSHGKKLELSHICAAVCQAKQPKPEIFYFNIVAGRHDAWGSVMTASTAIIETSISYEVSRYYLSKKANAFIVTVRVHLMSVKPQSTRPECQ